MMVTMRCPLEVRDWLNSLCAARNNGDLFVLEREPQADLDEPLGDPIGGITTFDPDAHALSYGTALEFSDIFEAAGITLAIVPAESAQSASAPGTVVLVADFADGQQAIGYLPEGP